MARPLRPFRLERYLAAREFSARHLLCCSDSEPLTLSQVLAVADDDSRVRWEGLSLAYTETQGLPALREAVAATYSGVSPEEVLVSSPQDCIYTTMQALLRPGDRVVVTHPTYEALCEVAGSIGCDLVHWECRDDAADPDGALRFDVDDLRAALRGDRPTRAVVVNFPHNPTGFVPTHDEWAAIVAAARDAGAVLFSDEMYRGLELDPARDRLASAVELDNTAIVLGGTSKTHGLPGVRMGWVVSHDQNLLRRVLEVKDFTTICSSAPAEILALIAMRANDKFLARQRDIVRANLELMARWARDWEHVLAWRAPRAGTIAFPRLLVNDVDADEFCRRALEEQGVLLLPASIYQHMPSQHQNRVRIGFGRKTFPEALAQFEIFLKAHYPKPTANGA